MTQSRHAFSIEAFRGEHGPHALMSHIGSLSLVDSIQVAAYYAWNPNAPDRAVGVDNQRVLHCTLTWNNLLVNTPDDPFVEFTDLEANVGFDVAQGLMLRHATQVMETSAWEDTFAADYASVADLVQAEPERLRELYVQLWPLLDDPDSVAALQAAGVDGAIHRGSAVSMGAVEYRVFNPRQVAVLGSYSAPHIPHDDVMKGTPMSLADLLAPSQLPGCRGAKL